MASSARPRRQVLTKSVLVCGVSICAEGRDAGVCELPVGCRRLLIRCSDGDGMTGISTAAAKLSGVQNVQMPS